MSRSLPAAGAALLSLILLAACGRDEAPPGAPPPPQVGVVTVQPQPLAVINELPGRLEASRVAEVRARASGIVQERTFREGSEVEAGQVLFRIDPAPLRAALNSAEANLAKARANLRQAEQRAGRYQSLVESNAISRLEYDDAVAARAQAAADVEAAKAALATARLNLGYATVTAPISGRIGRALVTEGALVGQGEATPLARIQQVDPLYLNLVQSAEEVLRLRRALESGQLQAIGEGQAEVTVITQDGRRYGHPAKLLFSDLTVDETTGAVTLRALVPNPDRALLPGMYVRARLEQAIASAAITVPQQAVNRAPQGASVMVVDDQGTVAVRPVEVGQAHGNSWIINDGLRAGDRVIVDGLQKIRPGVAVNPVAWQPPGQPQQTAQAKQATEAAGP